MRFKVIVGNIGTVYSGDNEAEAHKTYYEYREQSQKGYGRAAGETVTLLEDEEYVKGYWPLPHSDACAGCANCYSVRAECEHVLKRAFT